MTFPRISRDFENIFLGHFEILGDVLYFNRDFVKKFSISNMYPIFASKITQCNDGLEH